MDLPSRLRILERVPYFASLPLPQLRQAAAGLRERHYRAGAVICRQGDGCQGLCLVLSGRVQSVTTAADGRQQVLKVFGPGRTFGDIPVFDGGVLPADCFAVKESVIAVIPRTELLDLLRRHPDCGIDAIRLFASRLRAYKTAIENLSLHDVIARVALLLAEGTRGTAALVEDSGMMSPRYTQNEVAAMVGSVREVVQRALKTLERAGAIRMRRGRIHIVDVEALDAWTERRSPPPTIAAVALSSKTKRPVIPSAIARQAAT